MILLKIDAECVGPDPFERDPPRTVDGNGVALRFALQRMQSPTWQTQIVNRLGSVQSLQAAANPPNQIRADAAWIVVEKEVAQGLALEAHNHNGTVKR